MKGWLPDGTEIQLTYNQANLVLCMINEWEQLMNFFPPVSGKTVVLHTINEYIKRAKSLDMNTMDLIEQVNVEPSR